MRITGTLVIGHGEKKERFLLREEKWMVRVCFRIQLTRSIQGWMWCAGRRWEEGCHDDVLYLCIHACDVGKRKYLQRLVLDIQ